MIDTKPNIFKYSDYRIFIKDNCRYQKEENSNFSYRYFAKKAGFSSASYLSLIIDGKRNLSKNFIPGFSTAMGLLRKERQYFDALVSFNHARTAEARRYYLELIHNLRSGTVGDLLSDKQYEYLSNWYYPVIRELVSLPNFSENPSWIKKQLKDKITLKEARTAVDVLVRLDLVERNESGRLQQKGSGVVTEEEVGHIAAYSFHKQMLKIADEVLSTILPEHREISGMTMAVSKKQFNEIKKLIQDFEKTIAGYIINNPDVPDKVVQLNLQLFPVSTSGTGG